MSIKFVYHPNHTPFQQVYVFDSFVFSSQKLFYAILTDSTAMFRFSQKFLATKPFEMLLKSASFYALIRSFVYQPLMTTNAVSRTSHHPSSISVILIKEWKNF